MKRKSGFIACLCLLLSMISQSFVNAAPADGIRGTAFEPIQKRIDYLNAHDFSQFTNLFVSREEPIYSSFFANPDNEANKTGVFNIKEARLVSYKELPLKQAAHFVDLERYQSLYKNVKVFYLAVDNQVFKEDKYALNGINYYIAVMVAENNIWKIAEFSTAPVESLVKQNLGFGTSDEKEMSNLLAERYEGVYKNRSNQILAQNIDGTNGSHKLSSADASMQTLTTFTAPSYISVYLTDFSNFNYYHHGGPAVESIPFYYYVKNVLPNEWLGGWPAESLKAGALVIKMYGWYHTVHPKRGDVGADVDDTTNSQVFLHDTEITATTSAINAVGGIGLMTNSTSALFETQYRKGTYDGTNYQSSNIMSQYGTKYWADQSKTYSYMVPFYYTDVAYFTY